MNSILSALRQFFDLFRIWVIVSPWDQALRVRCGKHVKLLHAGIHLRVPGLDVFYIQSVRQRVSTIGRQTVTTKDGKTITYSGSLGYSISSVETLYRTLFHAEDTIQNIARAEMAQYFSTHDSEKCHPNDVEQSVDGKLQSELAKYGLSDVRVYVTEFSIVRTFRLIGDYAYGNSGSMLTTDTPYQRSVNTPV